MSGHTPGPWEYYPATNYCGYAIAPRGTLPTLSAVERPRGNRNTINVTAFNYPGETEANARLIASGPELLEALQRVMKYADHAPFCSVQDHPDFTCNCGLHAIRQAALAAISKATGEQP